MAHFIDKNKVDEYLTLLGRGNTSALSLLYDLTSRPLYALCYCYMQNQHDSEDALSETYVAIARSIDKYRGEKGYNWIYTIAKNICLNLLNKAKRNVNTDFDDEETVNVLGLSEEAEPVCHDESGIIKLSQEVLKENEFQIVVLHAVNGMRFKEIAKIVGGKEATVRWQYNNAISKVKKEYEGRGAG